MGVLSDRVLQPAVFRQLLLLLCQRNQGASVITVVTRHTQRLQDSGPLGDGASQLLLPPSETL